MKKGEKEIGDRKREREEKVLHKLATLFSLLAEVKCVRTVHYMYTLNIRFLQERKHVHA